MLLNLRFRSTGLRRFFSLFSDSSLRVRLPDSLVQTQVNQPAADGAEETNDSSTTSLLVTSRNLNALCVSEKGVRALFQETLFHSRLNCVFAATTLLRSPFHRLPSQFRSTEKSTLREVLLSASTGLFPCRCDANLRRLCREKLPAKINVLVHENGLPNSTLGKKRREIRAFSRPPPELMDRG